MFEFEEEINEKEEFSNKIFKLDINLIKEKIPKFSSKKLCEMIVVGRYFKFNEEIDVFCMEELAIRRTNGDNFDFESFIEESSKKLPVLDFSMAGFDIRQVLNQVVGKI